MVHLIVTYDVLKVSTVTGQDQDHWFDGHSVTADFMSEREAF